MTAIVREYRDDDRQQCRALWRELTEHHRDLYQDPAIGGENPEDYFDKHLATVGPEQLWVAVHDSEAVGLTGLMLKEDGAEIEPLIVSKAYRGKGMGKQLIERVVSEARKRGVRYLCVNPVARNTRTIEFLYRQGFRKIGQIELLMYFSDLVWKPGPEILGFKFDY